MKKLAFVLLILSLITQTSFTQEVLFDGFGGYHIGTSKDYGSGQFRITDGEQFGGSINVDFNGNGRIGRLRYVRQFSEFFVDDSRVAPGEVKMSDLQVHWIQLGVYKQWDFSNEFYAFAGLDIGTAIFQPLNQTPDLIIRSLGTTARFNLNIHGGARYFFWKGLGVQVDANLMLPADWAGQYFSFGTGGPSVGISIGSTTLLPAFNAGLVYSFGKED